MIKEVKRYQTSDGRLFEEKAEAKAQDRYLRFEAWFDEECTEALYSQSSSGAVDGEDVRKWLVIHQERIETFYREGDSR